MPGHAALPMILLFREHIPNLILFPQMSLEFSSHRLCFDYDETSQFRDASNIISMYFECTSNGTIQPTILIFNFIFQLHRNQHLRQIVR